MRQCETGVMRIVCSRAAGAVVSLALFVGPGSALETEQARARAIAKLRVQIATARELTALPPGSPGVIAAPADMDPVASRLQATFALIVPEATLSAEAPGEAIRLPQARPEPDTEIVALAYAAAPKPQRRTRTQGIAAIEALVEEHAAANDVPPDLAHALVQVESSYNPEATGSNGEIGLLQIKPQTARSVGYTGSAKALYDPETNLAWGLKYLGRAHELAGGDTCGTLLRYNSGLDAKRKSAASNRFCAKVKSVMAERA